MVLLQTRRVRLPNRRSYRIRCEIPLNFNSVDNNMTGKMISLYIYLDAIICRQKFILVVPTILNYFRNPFPFGSVSV